MKDFFIIYQDQILLLVSFLAVPVSVFLISLSAVYVSGRMLGIVNSDIIRNVIAISMMVLSYWFYFEYYSGNMETVDMIWRGAVYISTTIVIYVNVGFKFYERFDDYQDKHFGKDKEPGKNKK